MTTNFCDRTLLARGTVTTPTDGDRQAYIFGKNQPFMVQTLRAIVVTQGAQAASKVQIQNDADNSVVATITLGTSAAKTKFEVKVAEASRLWTASDLLKVVAVTTDASIKYEWEVYGTYTDM